MQLLQEANVDRAAAKVRKPSVTEALSINISINHYLIDMMTVS